MLKRVLENKKFDPAAEMTMDVGGVQMTKAQLERAKAEATENLAREREPEKVNEAAVLLARINTAIDAFGKIEQAQAEAEPLRQKLHAEEAKFADMERQRFEGYCKDIARPALKLLVKLENPGRGGSPEERSVYLRAVDDYIWQLETDLSFDDAERQAGEIMMADRERREWKVVVRLPQPKNVPLGPNQGRIIRKPPEGSVLGGHWRTGNL